MDFARKNQQIANSFYNLGLENTGFIRRGRMLKEEPPLQ